MPHDFVNEAQQTLIRSHTTLDKVLPGLIKCIIRDELWRRTNKEGKEFNSFREFCEYKLWWGLECPFDRLRHHCQFDQECTALLLKLVDEVDGHGGDRKSSLHCKLDKSNHKQHGNKSDYIVSRLKRDAKTNDKAADLLAQVLDGKIKPHAAAVEMGYKKKPDPVAQAQRLIPNLPPPAKIEIWQELGRSLPDDFDYLTHAKEAAMNLEADEIEQFKAWVDAKL